jgi:putative IMPACT (imprinted ancient) family translation regulator
LEGSKPKRCAFIISDRGSKYAVSGGLCASEEEAKAFIKALCRKKKFAKASHNTWALLSANAPLKNDDGEEGAGMVILRMLDQDAARRIPHQKLIENGATFLHFR